MYASAKRFTPLMATGPTGARGWGRNWSGEGGLPVNRSAGETPALRLAGIRHPEKPTRGAFSQLFPVALSAAWRSRRFGATERGRGLGTSSSGQPS